MVTEMEDSPVIENVLAVSAYFKRSGVDPGSIEHSSEFCPIVTLDGAVDRKGPIIGVAETPPGSTAGPSEVRVAVWMNTSPVSPGDNPPVAENIVISAEGGCRGLNSPNLLKLGAIVDGRETGDEGIKL